MKKLFIPILSILFVVGCATTPRITEISVDPIVPGEGEKIDVDNVIVIVDSSRSMNMQGKFPAAINMAKSFVKVMPEGDYNAGFIVFGNERMKPQPLLPFNRAEFMRFAAEISYMGGSTPFDVTLQETQSMLRNKSGKTAIVFFSDGRPNSTVSALIAAEKLLESYRDTICIHAVQIGEGNNAAQFLQKLVSLTPCGSYHTAQSINNPASLTEFARDVFLGEAEIEEEEVVVEEEPKDSDGDGVYDENDECPGTPKGAKVDERGCWVIPAPFFEYDKYVIKEEFYDELNEVADVLKQNPDVRIHIDGHTDSQGTESYNLALSKRRAEAVRNYLIDQGIEEDRLQTRAFGETEPIAPNTSEENMAKNRRVELSVIR